MNRSMLKKTATVLAFVACIGVQSTRTRADDMSVHLGYYFDSEALSFGFGMLTSVTDNQPRWFFNPNAEMIVGDSRDMAAFNADFHYDFASDSDLTFWAGAGPGLYLVEQPSNDDLHVGLNLLGGFGKLTGSTRPFVQGKVVVMDNSEASLAVGLRF
jgi:hypothetical protein